MEGLCGEVEGGWCARGVKKVCDGAKREEGVGSLGAPLVAGGTRGKRGMGGVRSACGHVKEEGGLAMAHARAGGLGHERVRSGGGNPGTAAPCCARGRQGKRERRARVGETDEWGLANRGKGAGDRWGWLHCRWFKLNQAEPNQFERI
jgi:hypothetical protein